MPWMTHVLVVTTLFGSVIAGLPAGAMADEAPIAGTVKAVDVAAKTITVEARARGKAREVVIDVRPETKIVRFARSTDAQKPGIIAHAARLEDIQPGWTVSVRTHHEGQREVADDVRVVHEK